MKKNITGYCVLAALLIMATVLSIRPVEDIDVQWHLRIGSWMLDNGRVVTEDFFSISKWGREWISVPWLYECMLAWLVRSFGWAGPAFVQWLVSLAIVLQSAILLCIFQGRKNSAPWKWPSLSLPAALAALHVLFVTEVRFQHRPEMFSHVFIPLYIIFFSLCYGKRQSVAATPWLHSLADRLRRGWIWILPLIQTVWANSHGVFAMGPIIAWTFTGAAIFSAVAGGKTGKRAGTILQFTGVSIAVTCACFISPYGAKSALYPLHLLHVLTSPVYKYGISEAVPVSLANMWKTGGFNLMILAAWTLAAMGLAGRLITACQGVPAGQKALRAWLMAFDRETGLGYTAVCAGLMYISLTAIRNIPLFSLAGAPFVAWGMEYAAMMLQWLCGQVTQIATSLKKGEPDTVSEKTCALSGLAGPASTAAWAGFFFLTAFLYYSVVTEGYYEWMHRPTRFAIGQSDHTFPLEAVRFLEEHLPEMGKTAMFGDTKSADLFLNRFGPAWKTYIDGRHAEIYDAPFFQRYGEALGKRGIFFSEAGKYGIGIAMFSVADMNASGGALQKDIYRHPGWDLVYLDDSGVVFLARIPANEKVLEKYAMPAAPKSRDDQERLYAEWLKKTGMQEHPDLYMAGNENLAHGTVARILPLIFRFGGLLGPERNRKSWNMARTASLLSRLGWPAVADNIYEEAMKIRPLNMAAAEEAVNHAIACFEACSTQELRILYINRLNDRCLTMLEQDAGYPTALYGKAYVKMKSGHQDEAVAILEKLLQKRQDKPIMNLYAMALGEAGDMAGSLREKERLWEKAVTAWRKRLTLYPQGPDTFKAYLRLGDLFTRLGYSLEARANYVLALNEPDIPPEIAKKARKKVRKLEIELWGGSFIPVKNKMPDSISPFVPPLGPETAVKNRGAGQPGGRIGMGPPGRGPGIGAAPHAAQGAPERGIMPGPPGKRPERP